MKSRFTVPATAQVLLANSFIRFLVVAGCASIVHMSMAAALIWLLPDVNLVALNSIAFACAVFVSYHGHSRFTFKAQGRKSTFMMTTAIALGINSTVVFVVDRMTDLAMVSVIAGMFVASMSTYLLSRVLVFKPRNSEAASVELPVDVESLPG